MTDAASTLCLTSYNSGGMGMDKQNFISLLSLFSVILWIQEHFLLDSGDRKHSNTNKLKKYFGETHDMYIVPAFKEDIVVKPGWGKWSLATMWRKGLTKY